MPLKPGQTKELKVKLKKLTQLQELQKKSADLTSKWLKTVNKSPSKISKKAKMLANQISDEIEITRKEIAALEEKAKKDPALVKLVNAIKKDCSQVLPIYRKSMTVLLRGVTTKNNVDAYVGRSWESRKPTHSKQIYQDLYDTVLKKNGFKALRSNSVFTTGNFDHAAGYGKVYIIFPKNGFAFHWNKEIPDLVIDDPTLIFKEGLILDIIDAATEWHVNTYKKNIEFDLYDVYRNPQKFIDTLKSIKYPKAASITIDKLVDAKYIMRRVGPTNKNFTAGLESGHEVMIAGEYYAIRDDSELAEKVLAALDIDAVNRIL